MSEFATEAQDVVAVLTSDFEQVFEGARTLKLTVERGSKVMEHPVETGVTITDHRVILAVPTELSMIAAEEDFAEVYQEIVDLFKKGELLIVQTNVDSFSNMLIEKLSHDESGDIVQGIAISLRLKEVLIVTPQYSTLPPKKVARPADADTAKRGQQQPAEPKGSILSGWFK